MDYINDDNDMSEKILKQLQNIINEDDMLKEFSLIPTSSTDIDKNVSPVKYSLEEHCIGLETWCVQHVFKYAQHQILKLRKKPKKSCDSANILNRYLIGALLIQPEVTTFWNIKRELVQSKNLNANAELKFAKLILSFKTKSFEAFAYRSWLFKHVNEQKNYKNIFDEECDVLQRATCNTPNNYHAWNHRIWCFQNIVLPYLPKTVQLDELKFSEQWILTHVSEHSGFHYRQYVLNRFKQQHLLSDCVLVNFKIFNVNNCNIINSMLDSEYIEKFEENDLLLYNQYICLLLFELFKILPTLHCNYPGHESVWYHRRYVMSHIYQMICEIYGLRKKVDCDLLIPILPTDVNIIESNVCNGESHKKNYKLLALESSHLYKSLVIKEREFLKSLTDTNKWNANDLDLSLKYDKWLQCILHVSL